MNNHFEQVSLDNPKTVLYVKLKSDDFETSDFVDLCLLNKVGETHVPRSDSNRHWKDFKSS